MESRRLNRTEVELPAIGMGTWNLAPPDTYAPAHVDRRKVIAIIKVGIDLGLTHIDTAESYGDGEAELIVAEAIKGIRGQVFLASKVEPAHYRYEDVLKAAGDSCRRLGTDWIDLYQLHAPSSRVPIEETMRAMDRLVDDGTIRFIGVSNFSVDQLTDAQKVMSEHPIVSNQVKYNLIDREIEKDLLPYTQKQGVTIAAYSPFDTGRLLATSSSALDRLREVAQENQKSPTQVCLNWLVSKKGVVTIPKAIQQEHVRENAEATGWKLRRGGAERLLA